MWFGDKDSEARNLKEVSFPNEVHLNEKIIFDVSAFRSNEVCESIELTK